MLYPTKEIMVMFEGLEKHDYDYSKSRKKGRLVVKSKKFSKYSDRYCILMYPATLLLFGIIGMCSVFKNRLDIRIVSTSIIMLSMGAWLLYISIRGIVLGQKFFRLKASSNSELNRQMAVTTLNELGWRILRNTRDSLMAVTDNTMFSWGQSIILLYDHTDILICCDNRTGLIGKVPILLRTHKTLLKKFCDAFNSKLLSRS